MGRKVKAGDQSNDNRPKSKLKTGEPIFTSHETYNVQKLLWILKHKRNDFDDATLKRYQDMVPEINCSLDSWPYGTHKVDYYYGNMNEGRLCPVQFAYILMSKVVRHTIADDMYADLDFVNCHPTIFMYLVRDIISPLKEIILRYCYSREQCIQECVENNINCSENEAKNWFLMVLNGGEGNPYLACTPYMLEYKEAIRELCVLFLTSVENSTDFKRYKEFIILRDGRNANNLNAKIISCYLLRVEDTIRLHLVNFLQDHGFDASVQCYDGVMSFLRENKKNIEELDLNMVSAHIKAVTGVQCNLKLKPLNTCSYNIDLNSLEEINFSEFERCRVDNSQDYESVKRRFERNNFFCLQSVTYYYEESDMVLSYSKTDFVTKWEHLQFNDIDDKGNIKPAQFVNEWIKDPNKRAYPLVGLFPPGYESHHINTSDVTHPRYAYSIWKGLRVQHIVPDNNDYSEAIQMFRDHTLYLCSGHDEFRVYLERCLKHLFTYPGRKTDVAIAFKAVQGGEGKNTWWEFVSEIIGRQYCYHSSNHERDWFGDFNEGLRNKLWVHMEEISKNTLTKHQKQFLAYVTSKEDVINLKGGKKVTCPSYCNYFLTFNSQGIDMFPGLNRRLWINEMANHVVKPAEYYVKMYGLMKNPQCLRAVYDWIMTNVDISNFNPGDETKRPFTPYMNKLWGKANAPKDKLEQWCYDKILELWGNHINPNIYRVRLKEFYESFKTEIGDKNFLPSIQTFSQRVQDLVEKAVFASKSRGVLWFKLDLDECMQVFVNKQWITWEDLGFREEYDTLYYACVRPCKKACANRESRNWSDEARAVQHFNKQRENFLQYTCECNGCFEVSRK